jgi:hypothetical protein
VAVLGASRSRQLRQTLTETLLLTTLRGTLGIALAWMELETVKSQAAGILPRVADQGFAGRGPRRCRWRPAPDMVVKW